MEVTSSQRGLSDKGSAAKRQRNLGEVIEYFDAHWNVPVDETLQRVKMLDRAFDNPSKGMPAIFIAGTNGKSITAYFTAKLLAAEGLTVGTFTAPHLLMYKERFGIDLKAMPSRIFTELGNEIIAMAEELSLTAHTSELLTVMALLHFKRNNVDVAILEVSREQSATDPVTIVDARVATITRVTPTVAKMTETELLQVARAMASIVTPGMHVVSADQSKSILSLLQKVTQERGGHWGMPVRKLAHLVYPFEQLLGRCAALAERIAQLLVEENPHPKIAKDTSLLVRTNGKRGRPSLTTKREQELNPRKTIDQFWKEIECEIPGKFEALDKEKPTVLLDTASNIDALKNLLLGIRLRHYQRPLKGLTIVVGAAYNTLHNDEFLKLIRYFFKKTPGQIFICPPGEAIAGVGEESSWDVEQVINELKTMKVKYVRGFNNFEEAFEAAKKSVDERHGIVVITGSQSIVANYWKSKGVKKLQ